MMRPSLSPGPWWTAHLQLPGYDPIATAGACHFDIRAAEQALVVWTQWLSTPLSPSDHYPHRFSKRLATRQPSTSNVKSRRPRHKVRTPGIPSLRRFR